MPETAAQMKDLRYQAGKAGLKPGVKIQVHTKLNKDASPEIKSEADALSKKVFEITECTDSSIRAVEYKFLPTSADHQVITKSYEDAMQSFRVSSKKVTCPLEGYSVEGQNPLNSTLWLADCKKGACSLAVRQVYERYSTTDMLNKLHVSQHPTMVHAIAPIKKDELKLVAASSRYDSKAPPHGTSVSLGKISPSCSSDMQMMSQFVSPLDHDGECNKNAWVSLFWCVKPTSEDRANMKLRWEVVEVLGYMVSVPILYNFKAIKTNEDTSI